MGCSYLNFYKYFLHFECLGQEYYETDSIHLNSLHHSRKKQKDSPETQKVVFVDIFIWTWNIWPYREYIKMVKSGSFCEELLSENDFVTVLANFCCYDYGANASEAVQKISSRTLELYASSLKQLIL